MVSFLIVYEDEPVNWDHLVDDAESKTPLSHTPGQKKDNCLWITLLGLLGVAWLLGKEDDDI